MLKNEKDLGLIEVIVAAGIMCTAVSAIVSLNLQLNKSQKQTTTGVQLDVFRRSVLSLVTNDSSWARTIRYNANESTSKMRCLHTGAHCTVDGSINGAAIVDQPFALLDGADRVFYDSLTQTNGLSLAGVRCDTYPSPACPLRFRLLWSAMCVAGSCANPQVKVDAILEVDHNQLPVTLNTGNFSVPEIYRNAQ